MKMQQEQGSETYLVHTQAEPPPFSSLSTFRRDFKVYLDDTEIVDLRTYRVHAVRGWGEKDFLTSRRDADAHEKVDDLVRPDTEEDMVYGGQTTQFRYAAL